ncbi:MAG TPA: peptide ABC transporter substrate-binding protein [Chloroflexota bacterium]|nr:peptide ABC transporter substrate-binding protein [Chloroflexota bacterium]
MRQDRRASRTDLHRSVVTRRELLRVGLTLAALPLFAACAPAAPAAPTAAPAKPAETKPAAPAATSAPAAAAPAKPAEAATPAAAAPASTSSKPTGTLKLLFWQAPTILNPHLSSGTKDYLAARCCTEPLITVDAEGKISPVLAAEVPSQQNGGVAADGKSVTYKLKSGVKWADGQAFSAEDVAFTFEYVSNKESSATTAGTYQNIDKVEAIDPGTVKITFKEPTGGWFVPFAGTNGQIIPKHIMKDFVGAKSREAPINTKLIGTGPYVVDDFKPGDLVVYKPNPHYRDLSKMAFDRLEIKGGGDAVSAARAVFQTGEFDYSWNLQVEATVLQDIMNGGKGDLVSAPGSGTEQFFYNFADNTKEVNGETGAPGTKHPFLTDIKVREAMTLAVDRATIVKQLYGDGLLGNLSPNILTTPTGLQSKNTTAEFNIEKASKVLDDAGYKRGGDGIRVTPSGLRMKVVFVTSINSLRQKEQAIIKDGWQKIGIETELKSVDQSVFFSSDPSNPDIYARFSADVLMFSSSSDSPFPVQYMNRFYTGPDPSTTWSQKSNNYAGRNFLKWKNEEYDKTFEQVLAEVNVEKATQLWMQLNDIVVKDFAAVPLVDRLFADGKTKSLTGPAPRTFDIVTWNIGEWKKG